MFEFIWTTFGFRQNLDNDGLDDCIACYNGLTQYIYVFISLFLVQRVFIFNSSTI